MTPPHHHYHLTHRIIHAHHGVCPQIHLPLPHPMCRLVPRVTPIVEHLIGKRDAPLPLSHTHIIRYHCSQAGAFCSQVGRFSPIPLPTPHTHTHHMHARTSHATTALRLAPGVTLIVEHLIGKRLRITSPDSSLEFVDASPGATLIMRDCSRWQCEWWLCATACARPTTVCMCLHRVCSVCTHACLHEYLPMLALGQR